MEGDGQMASGQGWGVRVTPWLLGLVMLLLVPVALESLHRSAARRETEQQVGRHREAAGAALAAGDTATALVALEAAGRLAGPDAELEIAWMQASVAHAAANPRGIQDREVPTLTHAVAVLDAVAGGPSSETLTTSGHLALREGRADRAQARFQAAIAANPGQVHAHLALGALYRERKQPLEAVAAFEAAVKAAPEDITALNNLGVQYAEVGRRPEAIALFERAIAKQDNAAARLNAADALVEQKRTEEARAHLERAVQMAPRSPIAHRRLGELLHRAGKLAEAEQPLLTSLELQANPDVMERLGLLYLDLQRNSAAVEILNRLAGQEPRRLDGLFLLAKALEGVGDKGRAVQAYSAFLQVAQGLPGEAARVQRVRQQIAFLSGPVSGAPRDPAVPAVPEATHQHDGLPPHPH
jgi:tetratricopeptide (TPR) repeat protein